MNIATISNTMKTIMVSIALLVTFVGTALSFDSRYLHVADFKQYTDDKKRLDLEDKIFALEIKKKLSAEEQAFLNRYKRQLNELNKRGK